jgi:uroporphyrinogen decarboxylase
MTSKERVRAALRREPADRVPIFMWFHPVTARRLAKLFDVPRSRVGEVMGNDVRQAWVNNNFAMEGIVHERQGESHVDYWGIRWVKAGDFNQIAHFPLAQSTREELLDYRFPVDHMDALLEQMTPLMAHAEHDFIGVDVSPCVFEMYWRLRGMEPGLTDLASDVDLASTMLGRCADFAVALSQAALDRFEVDWLWTGDDVAGQQSMMMSPQCWRDLVKPHMARSVEVGVKKGLPVAYHSCGALGPIIPDLIEIGITVLNPIQCNCPGMDAADLKKEFGDALTFMGGVDTQYLLPNGSPEEVRRATQRLLEVMTSDGGGYILAASHTVPPETPFNNLFAMYEVAGLGRADMFDRAADIRKEITATKANAKRKSNV